jgi:hypothetical protein
VSRLCSTSPSTWIKGSRHSNGFVDVSFFLPPSISLSLFSPPLFLLLLTNLPSIRNVRLRQSIASLYRAFSCAARQRSGSKWIHCSRFTSGRSYQLQEYLYTGRVSPSILLTLEGMENSSSLYNRNRSL